MDRDRILYLIKKFRSKRASNEEIDELESFWHLAQNDKTLFTSLTNDEKEAIRKAMFEHIKERITALEQPAEKQRSFPVLSWTLKIAASVAIVLTLAIYFTGVLKDQDQHQTAYGDRLMVTLPDNSRVVMNGNSKLRYDDHWDDDQDREVWIEGEGYFDVTHTTNHQRFIVHTTNGMDVQVLGTKFNVKVRRGKAEVMLEEGKVRLDITKSDESESLLLRPGELATLEHEKLLKTEVKAEEYVSWKENKLFFEQTPLRDIAMLLEDTYGMTVVFENNSLSERRLSGEISADNVTDILEAIQESLDIRITHDQRHVIFHQ